MQVSNGVSKDSTSEGIRILDILVAVYNSRMRSEEKGGAFECGPEQD